MEMEAVKYFECHVHKQAKEKDAEWETFDDRIYLSLKEEHDKAKKVFDRSHTFKMGHALYGNDCQQITAYEPYFKHHVWVATIDYTLKTIRMTHGYYAKHPYAKTMKKVAQKLGYQLFS